MGIFAYLEESENDQNLKLTLIPFYLLRLVQSSKWNKMKFSNYVFQFCMSVLASIHADISLQLFADAWCAQDPQLSE